MFPASPVSASKERGQRGLSGVGTPLGGRARAGVVERASVVWISNGGGGGGG